MAMLIYLYIWDKSNGRVVILSKNGDYRKTIESSILSKASSVEVFADAAYAPRDPRSTRFR